MTKPVPKVYATRFFQLISTRQFAEAERILERLRQKIHVSERNRGYFQALYGMLLTQKNNDDRYAFLSSADVGNKKMLRMYRQEFQSHVDSRLHGEYDRGFFEAWVDYMKILPKLELPAMQTNNRVTPETKETTLDEAATVQQTQAPVPTENQSKVEAETTPPSKDKEEPPKERPKTEQFVEAQKTLTEYSK